MATTPSLSTLLRSKNLRGLSIDVIIPILLLLLWHSYPRVTLHLLLLLLIVIECSSWEDEWLILLAASNSTALLGTTI